MSVVGQGGTTFKSAHTSVDETWQPTCHLAFIILEEKHVLHQLWQSSIGRTAWRPVVELDLQVAATYW